MTEITNWDPSAFPLFGCLTGFTLPVETVGITKTNSVLMRQSYFEIFTHPMMAFGPPQPPARHHPAPWVAVASNYLTPPSRVEFRIEHDEEFLGLSASAIAWLLAALLRLRVEAPVRIPAVANIELRKVAEVPGAMALALENSQHQHGIFRKMIVEATSEILGWVTGVFPNAIRLCHNDRFIRAFNIYDDASWSTRVETATTLVWTAEKSCLTRVPCSTKGEKSRGRWPTSSLTLRRIANTLIGPFLTCMKSAGALCIVAARLTGQTLDNRWRLPARHSSTFSQPASCQGRDSESYLR
jgi:hypothetical protein